jgi:glycine betaine/proline transport system ATP-binding protein
MSAAVEFKDVDILFARQAGRAGRKAMREALARSMPAARAPRFRKLGVIVGVAGASLSVARGEISVLMGLSGSGQVDAAARRQRPEPGDARHVLVRDGESAIDVATCDALQMRRLRRERVAMVFQQFGLLPWRTVRENVGFGLELRGEPARRQRQIVDEKLELVGLSQWADRTSASCRAACSSASASRARSPPMRTSC